jgi:hypothetical protein
MPSTPIYTKSIYQKNILEEDLLEAEASIRSSYICYSSLLLGLINIGLYYMENILFYLRERLGRLGP